MSYNTYTRTSTYTVVDIRKVFEGFEADLRMISRRTGKLASQLDDICYDVLQLAESNYLESVDITLISADGTPLQASRYTINTDGSAQKSDRPGGNNWVAEVGSELTVIVKYNAAWRALPGTAKETFEQKNLRISWQSTTIDTSYSNLRGQSAQAYVSKGYELNKQNFTR